MMRRAFVAFILVCASCGWAAAQTQLANPASERCVEEGGVLQIEQHPNGGQFGVCVFADNRQCEEWAMFRVECPAGGVRVTGYLTPAARYCAITGGRYTEADGSCALPGGKICDVAEYFDGTCTR